MAQEVPENILRKIKALLAKADPSKNDSQAEIETAARMAQDLMLQWNLSNADLKDKPKIDKQFFSPKDIWVKNEGPWLCNLYQYMAEVNFCKAWYLKGRWGLFIAGDAVNREACIYMIEQLIPRIRLLAKQAYKDYQGDEKRNAFIRGFLHGCSTGIYKKLKYNFARTTNFNKDMYAMVLVKNADLEAWVNQTVKIKSVKGPTLGARDGQSLGFEAGQKMEVHKGLNKNELNQNLLG